jgi:hypothetical protein
MAKPAGMGEPAHVREPSNRPPTKMRREGPAPGMDKRTM